MKEKTFLAAMYLRLSRDDIADGKRKGIGESVEKSNINGGTLVRTESNSIGNQRELIKAFIREQPDIELYDIYVDDGFSGSNFDRPDFKRMISDIEAGRVNCVIVKDLSRFGRDYIESGRYIQKIFPALSVRFIALTDHYDSASADMGESSIVLPVKNFINDSYCRDISTKVKSQLAIKRKNGECIAPFAVYGYMKSPEDKNQLVVDEYAAEVVRKIFSWKIEGLSFNAIAKRLNDLYILPPKEYKQSKGLNYTCGFPSNAGSGWSCVAVKRILTNETYLGHLIQGKTEKINYKVKKSVEKPKEEWIRVENAHEAIISESDFQTAQRLLKTDGRICTKSGEINPFAGLLFCGDCGEQMVRRVISQGNYKRIFYICSTKNRGDGCSRHSIEEGTLKELVTAAVREYANGFLAQEKLFTQIDKYDANFEAVLGVSSEVARLREEGQKYERLCTGLYDDLKQKVITKEEFERFHKEFSQKAEEFDRMRKKQEKMMEEMFRTGIASAGKLAVFKKSMELEEIDRYTLASMVKRIVVFEGKRIELEFNFYDQYRIMSECNAVFSEKISVAERSA